MVQRGCRPFLYDPTSAAGGHRGDGARRLNGNTTGTDHGEGRRITQCGSNTTAKQLSVMPQKAKGQGDVRGSLGVSRLRAFVKARPRARKDEQRRRVPQNKRPRPHRWAKVMASLERGQSGRQAGRPGAVARAVFLCARLGRGCCRFGGRRGPDGPDPPPVRSSACPALWRQGITSGIEASPRRSRGERRNEVEGRDGIMA